MLKHTTLTLKYARRRFYADHKKFYRSLPGHRYRWYQHPRGPLSYSGGATIRATGSLSYAARLSATTGYAIDDAGRTDTIHAGGCGRLRRWTAGKRWTLRTGRT